MLLVLSDEHKEHLSFLTKVDVEGEWLLVLGSLALIVSPGAACMQW